MEAGQVLHAQGGSTTVEVAAAKPGRVRGASPATVKTPPITAQIAVRNLYSCLGCSATTI